MARITNGGGGGGGHTSDDDAQDLDLEEDDLSVTDDGGLDAGGFGEELGGDPAGDADRDTSTADTNDDGGLDAGGFGEELGGDPAGDSDRLTPPADTNDDGGLDAGGFGDELGGDPAGDFDRDIAPIDPNDGGGGIDDDGGIDVDLPEDGGGIETLDIADASDEGGLEDDPVFSDANTTPHGIAKKARELEDRVLRNNPELGGDRSLVTVRREGDSLVASLTARGRQVLERERARQLESDLLADLGLEDPSLVRVTKQGDELVASLTLEGVERVASPELEAQLEAQLGVDLDRDDFSLVFGEDGIGAELTTEGVSKVRADRRAEAEDALEGLGVGAASLAATGGTDRAAARQVERNQEIQDALEGVGFFDEAAERRQGAIGDVERALERQVGTARAAAMGITGAGPTRALIESTDLRQGEDFTLEVTQTEAGLSIGASLTEEFRREFAEDVIESRLESSTGADLDAGLDFNIVFGDDGSATPVLTDRGRGRIALTTLDRTVEDLEAGRIPIVTDLTGIQGPEIDLVGGEGPAAPEARSTSALESERGGPLRDLEAEISGAADTSRAGLRQGEGTLRSPFTGERFLGQGVLEPLVAGGLRGAVDLGEQAGTLPLRFGDFLLAGNEAVDEDIERILAGETPTESAEFARQATAAGGRLPFVAASDLIGEVRDRPTRTLGALAGSLGVSAAAMRLLPASRFVIQPGEEALGSAGFGATRRLAGERRAQQLFPNREPLIFSEEFAIRQARRLGARLEGRTEAETGPQTTDPDLPAERPALLSTEAVDAAMGVTGPSRFALARGRARRGAASARESVGDLVESVNIRTGRIGAGFGSVEIEIEAESEGDLVRDFDPSRSEVLGGGASERAREQMVERQREARRMMGGDFEGVRDPVGEAETRREAAERPEVGLEEDALSRASIRSELALAPASTLPGLSFGILAGARARLDQRAGLAEDLDLATDADLGFESLLDLALDADLESKLETDLETEADLETETDLETDLESEILAEAETEAELELELRPGELNLEAELGPDDRSGDRRSRDPLEPVGLGIGTTTEGDLLPGFVSETIADIALTGRRSGRAPSEDVLEGIVESGEAPVEELPTFEEALGTEEEREAIEETRELFGFDLGGIRL